MDDLVPVHLRDGTEAFVVPLLPANREALKQEYEHLSPETRFGRFLTAVSKLSETMLDHLVDDVDGINHVALVLLVLTKDGTELPLGLARIVRYPDDPTTADLAVTVVDDWQGRGVATALLEVLMQYRPPGVERIDTIVQQGNVASLAMLRRLGDVELGQPEAGTQRVVVLLPDAANSGHVRRSVVGERDCPAPATTRGSMFSVLRGPPWWAVSRKPMEPCAWVPSTAWCRPSAVS